MDWASRLLLGFLCAGSLLDEERRFAETDVVRGIALRDVVQLGKLDETDDCLACCVALLALCELRCLPVGIEIVEVDDLVLQINLQTLRERSHRDDPPTAAP